ncbi:MAG: hypothetical protein WD267_05165 [Balneolales bacterium]
MLTLRVPGTDEAKIFIPDPINAKVLAGGHEGYLIDNNIIDVWTRRTCP